MAAYLCIRCAAPREEPVLIRHLVLLFVRSTSGRRFQVAVKALPSIKSERATGIFGGRDGVGMSAWFRRACGWGLESGDEQMTTDLDDVSARMT